MIRPPLRAPARRRPARHRARAILRALRIAAVAVAVASLASCATFPDTGPRQWHDKPEGGSPLAAPPKVPEQTPEQEPPPANTPPGRPGAPVGCQDPDPLVVATCLDPVSAIAVLPDGQSALAAQRETGRIMRVEKGKPSQLLATVPVDAASGGLKGLVLSPSYDEDRLLYAYIATATDHRVVRVTPDGSTVPIFTGIPRTAGNDSGTIGVSRDDALIVATGADGSADSPGSLAGKILKIDTFGKPFKGNPDPRSPIYSSGLHAPGGMCTSPENGITWVTDRAPGRDALYRVSAGQLAPPAWDWPDQPAVAGCIAQPDSLAVAERGGSALFVLQTKRALASFTGSPSTALNGIYGRVSAATLGPDGTAWLGTENRGRGGPIVSSDDRVIRLPHIGGGTGGSGPE